MQNIAVAQNAETVIRNYIAEYILFSKNGYPYSDDASFLEDDIVDSTNMLELIMLVEESFNIKVDDEDVALDNFDSVAKLAAYVRRKVPSAN